MRCLVDRVTASNLPEEAGHSQYEMTSITMTPSGFLTPTRGKGRLPDSRTPPPTLRHTLTFADATAGANRGVDGSEANKENTVGEPPAKEPPVRISLSTGKDGATIVSGSGGSKLESGKSKGKGKGKKKDKAWTLDRAKKPKKTEKKKKKLEAKIKVVVGDSRPPSVTVVEPKSAAAPAKKAKVKGGRSKEGKPKEPKPAKASKVKVKLKEKGEGRKKPPPAPPTPAQSAGGGGPESRLKDLLLSQDKYKLDEASEPGPTLSPGPEVGSDILPWSESDAALRQAFPLTDIFDKSPSREPSPQRLVIAEVEGRAQEREEEKRVRLKNIDEAIFAVVRDSAADADKRGEQAEAAEKKPAPHPPPPPKTGEAPSPKKRGRPKKVKPKEKFKSSEFVAEEVMKREKEDDLGARNAQSINDTINSVIMQGADDPELPAPADTSAAEPGAAPPTPTPGKKPKKEGGKKEGGKKEGGKKDGKKEGKKEGKKKKVDKDKSPGVKKKLKAKLQNKADKGEAPAPPPPPSPALDVKPFVSDKFSNAEMKVFEFDEEVESPPSLQARRPSQAERELSPPPPLPAPATPPACQGGFSPVDVKPVVKSPTPEAALAASSAASTPSATSVDQPPILPLKIGIPKDKDKDRHREKSRVSLGTPPSTPPPPPGLVKSCHASSACVRHPVLASTLSSLFSVS